MLQLSHLIYKHTSPSGKSYIGQTKNLTKRTQHHLSLKSGCPAFQKAIQKYGWKNFKTDILAQDLSLDQANLLEEKYIAEYNTLVPNGYNLSTGGKCCRPSEETRARLSAAHTGMHHTNETKAKISVVHKGKYVTDETKAKISTAHLGKHHTDEHKAKLSAAHVGKHHTDETKAKISAVNKGRVAWNKGKPGTMLGRKRNGKRGKAIVQ